MGAPKIHERLHGLYPDVHTPAISTVHAVLDRNGLVPHGPKRRRNRATGTERRHVEQPNQLWCVDDKGECDGRIEERRHVVCHAMDWLFSDPRYDVAPALPGRAMIGVVESKAARGGKPAHERRYSCGSAQDFGEVAGVPSGLFSS